MPYQSINPTNLETLEEFPSLSKEDATAKIEDAHEAFQSWRTTDFETRKGIVNEFSNQLKKRESEYAEMITLEMGKPISQAKEEIGFCARIAEFYAEGAETFLADSTVKTRDSGEAYLRHDPIGVLMGVMPWNFPFYQVVRFAIPNIMAGNTILVRHASCVPRCAQAIEELFHEVGLPSGVYHNLFIPTEFVETIIDDSRIQGVSLTGSESAGRSVAAAAGRNLRRSVMELGGNDAFIVLEDADLEETVEKAVQGRLTNNGQSCVAAKRFIVHSSLYEDFTAGMKEAFVNLKIGDPMDPDTELGPLSTEGAAKDLHRKIQTAVRQGAEVVTGGGRPDRPGAFVEPTILTGITSENDIFDEELFGPVACIYRFEDEDQAIELANDSSYGLGGSVYTSDIESGRRVAEKVDTGMVFINQPTNSSEELPFGGIKNSGYGRELSQLGILEFVNKKLIHTLAEFEQG